MPSKDSTDNRARPTRRTLIALCAIALCSGSLWFPAHARADGDPASDVLATETLFLPQDAGFSATQQAQLSTLLASAERSGFRIRVAVVASPADLGSIGELWRQPQAYAHFLGQELGLVYRGTLLVVMPNGYGLYGVGGVATQPAALSATGRPSAALADNTIVAVRRLAGASGHPLPLPAVRVPVPPASSAAAPWAVFGRRTAADRARVGGQRPRQAVWARKTSSIRVAPTARPRWWQRPRAHGPASESRQPRRPRARRASLPPAGRE